MAFKVNESVGKVARTTKVINNKKVFLQRILSSFITYITSIMISAPYVDEIPTPSD